MGTRSHASTLWQTRLNSRCACRSASCRRSRRRGTPPTQTFAHDGCRSAQGQMGRERCIIPPGQGRMFQVNDQEVRGLSRRDAPDSMPSERAPPLVPARSRTAPLPCDRPRPHRSARPGAVWPAACGTPGTQLLPRIDYGLAVTANAEAERRHPADRARAECHHRGRVPSWDTRTRLRARCPVRCTSLSLR